MMPMEFDLYYHVNVLGFEDLRRLTIRKHRFGWVIKVRLDGFSILRIKDA